MNAEQPEDRRQFSRIAFHTPARLDCTGSRIDVVVLDISLKGALIRLPAETALNEGAVCVLRIHLDEAESGDLISMDTRVAHVEGSKVGLICQTIDIDSVTHLRRLVELNLGDPILLDREFSALVA